MFGLNVTAIEQVALTASVPPVHRSVPLANLSPVTVLPIWKVNGALPVFVKIKVAEAVEPTVWVPKAKAPLPAPPVNVTPFV